MCGRFTLTTNSEVLQEIFDLAIAPPDLAPRFNIAPTQSVAVVVQEDGQRQLDAFRWGLIPFWAKDMRIGNKMINARAETLAQKPSFRNAFKKRRCLILADGFYEWRKSEQGKTPTYIYLADHQPFAFAGLWESWTSPEGEEVRSCTIITTSPNEVMAPIHNRMPVILPPQAMETWLIPSEQDPQILQPLLKPYPPQDMRHHPISKTVNSPRNDGPNLIEPVSSSPL